MMRHGSLRSILATCLLLAGLAWVATAEGGASEQAQTPKVPAENEEIRALIDGGSYGEAEVKAERLLEETEAESVLRAKTGTLSTASALSGYVTCKSGESIAFSLVVNDYETSIQDLWRAQDDLGTALASADFRRVVREEVASGSGENLVEADPP